MCLGRLHASFFIHSTLKYTWMASCSAFAGMEFVIWHPQKSLLLHGTSSEDLAGVFIAKLAGSEKLIERFISSGLHYALLIIHVHVACLQKVNKVLIRHFLLTCRATCAPIRLHKTRSIMLVIHMYMYHVWIISIQCVKLTVTTSPMVTENYPLATYMYFVLPGAILGNQLL